MIKNKKLFSTIGIIAISIFFIVLTNVRYSKVINVNKDSKGKIILIDPGHGGMDGGAVSKRGTMEKGINLEISLKLKKQLEHKGYVVEMTREDDSGLYSENSKNKKVEDLNNRCKLKESSQCNMFISIHLNKFPQSKYYGAQVWYSKCEQSKQLAEIMQKNLVEGLDNNNNRKAKCAEDMYKVLRCNDSIPSVIVECGFLSNPQEEELLKDDEYQNKIAKCLYNSVEEYFKINDQ